MGEGLLFFECSEGSRAGSSRSRSRRRLPLHKWLNQCQEYASRRPWFFCFVFFLFTLRSTNCPSSCHCYSCVIGNVLRHNRKPVCSPQPLRSVLRTALSDANVPQTITFSYPQLEDEWACEQVNMLHGLNRATVKS